MPRLRFIIAIAVLAIMPWASEFAESSSCKPPKADALAIDGTYPDHTLSPRESLEQFDAVFLGEVVVATKSCSLGFCAGLKVLQPMKGRPGPTMLVQVAKANESSCAPTSFTDKGGRWLVFANQGTSPGGQKYFYTGDDGPSFPTRQLPDFAQLEGQYRMMRAQLDRAIESQLGHL